MKQVTITLYKLDELKPEARKKAIENLTQGLRETFEPQFLTEYFQILLDDSGLPGLKCNWSLGYCPGDGVAFYGKLNLNALLACSECKEIHHELRYLQEFGVGFEIINVNHHYHHWNSMRVEDDFTGYPDEKVGRLIEERIETVKESLLEYIRKISKELEKVGYADIEYQTSENMAIENAEDLLFLEDGTEWNQCK